jgi:hypothetical protein
MHKATACGLLHGQGVYTLTTASLYLHCSALQDTLRAIDMPVMGIFEVSADGQSAEEAAKVIRRYEPLQAAAPQRPSVAPRSQKRERLLQLQTRVGAAVQGRRRSSARLWKQAQSPLQALSKLRQWTASGCVCTCSPSVALASLVM